MVSHVHQIIHLQVSQGELIWMTVMNDQAIENPMHQTYTRVLHLVAGKE